MEPGERVRLDAFFARVVEQITPHPDVCSVVITHLLAERPAFLSALRAISDVRAVLPKPKSVDQQVRRHIASLFRVDALIREDLADPDRALAYLEERASGQPLVLLDVGGYFAAALPEVHARFSGRLLGVVEDTENGLRRIFRSTNTITPRGVIGGIGLAGE